MKNKIKNSLSDISKKPDQIIIASGIISSFVLLIVATKTKETLHEFFVNLSASMFAIAVTVILVDRLREHRIDAQHKVPAAYAVLKVLGSNSMLSLTIATKNRKNNEHILRNILQYTQKHNDDKGTVLQQGIAVAMKDIAKLSSSEILLNFSDDDLQNDFKDTLEKIREVYQDVLTKYGFSFKSIEMKTDYADLIESLDAVIGSLAVIPVGEVEMQKLFKPLDPKNPGEPMTIRTFIGMWLISYIEKYLTFVEKYQSKD